MPIVNVRDTIEGTVTTDDTGYGYMTRAINLRDGFRHQVESVDLFNDNGGMWLKTDIASPNNVGYQAFVSAYPMLRTDMPWGINLGTGNFEGAGQPAASDNVLYKEIGMTNLTENDSQQSNKQWISRFPNDAVSATPTSAFYTPHLYITVMVWNTPLSDVRINFSLFARVKQTKCSIAEAAMGQYQEFLYSQIARLSNTAVTYDPADISGYVFPMWKYGGQRPELMISGATALRYYNRQAANANQQMVTEDDLQTAFKAATSMVDFESAFGDAANNLPEWITLMDVAGVTSGAIRPYPPPLKFADNGNTLMF